MGYAIGVMDPDEWDEPADDRDDLPTIPPGELLDTLIEQTGAQRRAPQERMVHAIHEALTEGRHVAIEAGTGTGKSFGYLVGALATGKRVIVATSTKQLGEQLTGKDIPAVAAAASAIGRDIKVALLKGRSNYLCLQRLDETRKLADAEAGALIPDANFGGEADPTLAGRRKTAEQVKALMKWANTTETGDRSEAPATTEQVWSQFSTDSAACAGSACPFASECFATLAARKVAHADLAVTNHAMLAAYMRLHREERRTALSDYHVLVADEAHDLEASISRAWSVSVAPARIARTIDAAKRLDETAKPTGKVKDKKAAAPTSRAAAAMAMAREHLENATAVIASLPEGRLTGLPDNLKGHLDACKTEVLRLARMAKVKADEAADQEVKVGWVMLQRRLENVAQEIDVAITANPEKFVQWAVNDDRPDPRARNSKHLPRAQQRKKGGALSLETAPLSIADTFPQALGNWNLALTSATLTVAGRFEPLTSALGITAEGTDVGSPFDYPKQMMLYIPDRRFPAPVIETRAQHTEAVHDGMSRLIEAAGGRTLGLFTSTAAALNAAEVLRERFPNLNILAHGDAPMPQLVEEFREDETSVLLGTRGLWQGLSIDGPSCSVVTIDKIPFPIMNDPLMNARKAKVDEEGGRGFDEVMVTHAAISLAQGAGRLIRTMEDRGVLAVFDPRLRTKYYGAALMRSLPRVRAWDDFDAVVAAAARVTRLELATAA